MSDIEGSPRNRSRSASPAARNTKYSRSRSRSRHSHASYKSRSRSRARRSRSRSRSRSRGTRRYSRSRSRSTKRRSKYSRSRSYSPHRSRSDRSRSRSPLSRRRRHVGSRDHPKTSRCLGVFGLSLYTTERDVKEVFSRYGYIDEINLVHDHQTGRSRGFAFLYMHNLEDAVDAKERAAGTEIDGHKIRVDYSITERAHTPTPGVYLGRPTASSRGYRSERYSRRSPSPYNNRRGGGNRYSRSRSRERSYDRYERGYDRYRY